MAGDIRLLMSHLGHERFAVVGHDRGSYVAFRLAMDHPAVVSRLVLLDCVPIGEALARADAHFAQAWWHWFFFAQPHKPERAILADPDAWYGAGSELEARMGSQNYADWRAAAHDPAVVTAMLEDYRAGLGPDRADDEADRAAGRRLACPTLLLWSARDDLRSSTATSWPSGGPGPATSAEARSTAVTSRRASAGRARPHPPSCAPVVSRPWQRHSGSMASAASARWVASRVRTPKGNAISASSVRCWR